MRRLARFILARLRLARGRTAQLRRVGPGRYRAVLPASRLPAGRYLSLRATGRDAGASSVHQTLIRAAAIR